MVSNKSKKFKPETLLLTLGRNPKRYDGAVNTPVIRASTILHSTIEDLKKSAIKSPGKTTYGRHGTATTFALAEMISEIEGANLSCLFSSGKTAILASLIAFLKTGDHMLMVDSAYGPSRSLAKSLLKQYGISTTFYDPLSNANDIALMIKPETKVIYTESPGSLTFELQDLPAISSVAHNAGLWVITDNTWASPLYCNPFKLGADVSIQAGTKYIVGHSDVMLGVASANKRASPVIQKAFEEIGACPSPDDCYLALRGMRTLSVRLARHEKTGLKLAKWFSERPEVSQVLHPGMPNFPGYKIWKRDFKGASGLFGVILHPHKELSISKMLESLSLFGIGYSWGGYESLAIPTWPHKIREVSVWDPNFPLLRIHAGLEDPDDLIFDLESSFENLIKE